jgi:methyl acetate hydrolase
MSHRLPVLAQNGIKALDTLLQQRVARAETPAIFWLATNAKEAIYSNQGGLRTTEDDKSGQVNADTSELIIWRSFCTCMRG